jgi:hypothetical protein
MYSQINPVINKYDDTLNKVDPEQNKLLLQLSSISLTFTIFNQELNKFLSIESIDFSEIKRINEIAVRLNDYFNNHDRLKQSYRSVKIFFETNKSTIIPTPLFDPEEKVDFSKFNFLIEDQETLLFDKLNNLDAYLLYTFPNPLIKVVENCFPGHQHYSHSGALTESLIILNKNQNNRKTFHVNVRESNLDIHILDGHQLLYFNTFHYTSKEDFIYFIIFVLEQLQLNPEEVELILSGKIDRNSALFETLYKFVRNVSFQSKIEKFNYSYVFNDLPSHQFINLLNFELCES